MSDKQEVVVVTGASAGLGGAAFAVKLLIDQPTKYKAYCSWCVTGALASLAVVPLAWPEAHAALHRLQEHAPE